MQTEILEKLKQIIDVEISKLDDDDVQGHIWWTKFKNMVSDVETEITN